MSKVYLVASGKGGTGKTMFAVNLGSSYAQKGYKVVIVDMDMGLRNLDLYLGLENNVVYDVYDVMSGVCRIRQALIRDRRFDNLYIIGSSPEREKGDLTPLHVKVLCDKLKQEFDYIIVDAPSGIDDGMVLAASGADSAIIVATPEYAALRDADMVDRAVMKLGIPKRYFVINKLIAEMMNAGYIPGLEEITNMMRARLLGIIQFDMNINISTNIGEPIVLKRESYIRCNFSNIVDRLIKEELMEMRKGTAVL